MVTFRWVFVEVYVIENMRFVVEVIFSPINSTGKYAS